MQGMEGSMDLTDERGSMLSDLRVLDLTDERGFLAGKAPKEWAPATAALRMLAKEAPDESIRKRAALWLVRAGG